MVNAQTQITQPPAIASSERLLVAWSTSKRPTSLHTSLMPLTANGPQALGDTGFVFGPTECAALWRHSATRLGMPLQYPLVPTPFGCLLSRALASPTPTATRCQGAKRARRHMPTHVPPAFREKTLAYS